MALSRGEGSTADSGAPESSRALVAFVVIATHVALIFLIGRSTRHEAEIIDVMLLSSLPITPEEQRAEPLRAPLPEQKDLVLERRRASGTPAAAASTRAEAPSAVPVSPRDSERNETSTQANAPAAPIDWYAQAHATADALDQRDRANRERRPLDGPAGSALAGPRHVKPPCPFEKCEPGWGAAPSVFDSTATKAGRIEKTFDGEVIRWISNRCYQILVTPNILHRAMTRCVTPLKKSPPRGDLFKHMKEIPEPEDGATDVP